MTANINVDIAENDDEWIAVVRVEDAGRTTEHHVTVRVATYDALTNGDVPPEELLRASFAFLLDREPQDAILPRFDLTVIQRYFPEYPREIPNYYHP